jgi:predicted aspartyl protease
MRWLGRWKRTQEEMRLSTVTRWIVLLVACSILSGGVAARAQVRVKTEWRLDRDIVEIPFEYQEHQIVLKVQSGGHKDLTFLFDSGASAPVIDKELQLPTSHLGDASIQEAEGMTAAEAVWVDELKLGPDNSAVMVDNIPSLVTDLSQLSRLLGRHIDGIIGISFMYGFVVEIDYDRHILKFHSPRDFNLEQRKPDNERTFLFDLTPSNPHRPISTVLVHGLLHPKYEYDMLLDTGFGGYVGIDHLAAEEAGMIHADTPRVSTTSYSVSHRFTSDKIKAPFLMLGEINLSGKIVSIDHRNKEVISQTGIVGNRFLQNYHLTLDYQHKKLFLERTTTVEEQDEAEKPSFGIVIRSDGKTIKIDHVKPNSPAHEAGIRSGDMILSLNGQPCSSMSTAEVANVLAAAKSQTQFVLRRGVDPNLGTGGDEYVLSLTPTSPFDWQPTPSK